MYFESIDYEMMHIIYNHFNLLNYVVNPIVLRHGFPEHAFSWRYQILALVKAGYHVIIPHQRGYDNSSCPKNIQAYETFFVFSIYKLCKSNLKWYQ